MNNKERIYKLCECLIDAVNYLPKGSEWIEDNIREIMEDIDNEEA